MAVGYKQKENEMRITSNKTVWEHYWHRVAAVQESGQFNCIGAPTEERYDLIKDIPTLKEQGVDLVYPDCDFSFYFPADTSDDVIAYYEDLVQKVLADPSAAEGVANVDMMPYYLNAEDSAKNDEQIYNTIKEIADSLQQ